MASELDVRRAGRLPIGRTRLVQVTDQSDVAENGLACGLHRIERLKRRGKRKDDDEGSMIADNILDRNFQADRPNQNWLVDEGGSGRLTGHGRADDGHMVKWPG